MGKMGTLKSLQQLHSSLTHLQNLSGPVASVAFSTAGSTSFEISATSAAAAVTAAAAGVSVANSTTAEGTEAIVVPSSCLAFTSEDFHLKLALIQ